MLPSNRPVYNFQASWRLHFVHACWCPERLAAGCPGCDQVCLKRGKKLLCAGVYFERRQCGQGTEEIILKMGMARLCLLGDTAGSPLRDDSVCRENVGKGGPTEDR